MMSDFEVHGADEAAARLRSFQSATVFTEFIDSFAPTLVAALRLAAPKKTGRLADRIRAARETSLSGGAKADLIATTDAPYAPFVIGPTKAHSITARNAQALRWYDRGGNAVFATTVQHPAYPGNPFPRRVWIGLRADAMAELVERIRLKLTEE